MFFVFNDQNLLEIDKQFMVGHYLMVTPVLTQGATSVSAYFPANTIWYDFFTGAATRSGSSGTTQVLDAPIDKINVHVRAGGIIPMQVPATTTAATRKNAFKLLVALNQGSDALTPARGELYVDDGDSLTSVANSDFSRVHFEATQGGISTKPTFINHHKFLNPLGEITVYGLQNTTFVHVRVNGVNVPFNWANVDVRICC
jgi:alpha-glucosidase (family GH31 glycosyl hydrolase)